MLPSRFQSLLLWIWLTGIAGRQSPRLTAGFQSLLLWIWLTGTGRRRPAPLRSEVSILVVVDLAHRPSPTWIDGS